MTQMIYGHDRLNVFPVNYRINLTLQRHENLPDPLLNWQCNGMLHPVWHLVQMSGFNENHSAGMSLNEGKMGVTRSAMW